MENKTTNLQSKQATVPTQQSVAQNKTLPTQNSLNKSVKPVATPMASLNKKPVNPVQSSNAKPVASSNSNSPVKIVTNTSSIPNANNTQKPIGNDLKKNGAVAAKPAISTTNLQDNAFSSASVSNKPAEVKQVAESKNLESKPLNTKSLEEKKPDVKLEDSKKTELKPSESKPVVKSDTQTTSNVTPPIQDKKASIDKSDFIVKTEEKPQEAIKKEKKKKVKDKNKDKFEQTKQPKQGFSFLNFVLCLFILVTFAWLTVCSIFIIDVMVSKDINFFGKSVIYSHNDNLAPKIPDGSMCLYSKDTKNIKEGDIIIYFDSNNVYRLGAVEEINNVYYLIIGKDGNLIPVRKDKAEGVYIQNLETLQKFTNFITLKHNAIIFTTLPFVMVGVTELILFLYDRKKTKQKLALQNAEAPETQPETKEVVKITLIESKPKQEELSANQNKTDNQQLKENTKTNVDIKPKDNKLEGKIEPKAENVNKTNNMVSNNPTPKAENKPQMPTTPAPKVTSSGSAVTQTTVPVKPVVKVNDSKPEVTKTTIIETKTVKTITTPSGAKTTTATVNTTKPIVKTTTVATKPAVTPSTSAIKPATKQTANVSKPSANAVKPASTSEKPKSSANPGDVTIKLGANSGASTITVKQSSGSKPGAITIQLNSDKPKAPVAGQSKPVATATKPAPPKDGQK